MFDLIIKGATLVTSSQTVMADVCIKDGKIAAIAQSGCTLESGRTIDAKGKMVFPGFIDTHVHSRDGGATHKEDFYHSTRAAAAGGVTTIFEMPNIVPATSNRENFLISKENLESKAYVDFGMWAICLGDINNSDLQELSDEGVVGFKFFWGYSIRKDNFGLVYSYDKNDKNIIPALSDGEVYKIFQAVSKTGKKLAVHAENASLINTLTELVNEADYPNPYEAQMVYRPIAAEVAAFETAITFAKASGAKLHILHVTSGDGAELIREAKAKGLLVTGETCPQYLFLTNEDFDRVGNMMKCFPPVRFKDDQNRLWEELNNGTLDHVCSDHAPHTVEEKEGDFKKSLAGMCGVETMVPLMLDAASKGKISYNKLAQVLSENPAKEFGLYPQKGSLEVGFDADITIVDPDKEDIIKTEKLHSISKITPFDGTKVKGMPVCTILRGNVIMENGEITKEENFGKFLKA